MTVIPKKRKFQRKEEDIKGIADYGQKYHCDSCQKDISQLVRISCSECKDFDLCVECFASGVEPRDHKKTHDYRVIVSLIYIHHHLKATTKNDFNPKWCSLYITQDLLDFPIFEESWGADEELLLIEGLEVFGMGNWEQIAEHIGTKNKTECYDHYLNCYINSESWPIPVEFFVESWLLYLYA